MWNFLLLVLFISISLFNYGLCQVQLRVIRQWKYLNYTWPNQEILQTSMVSGLYIPENIVTSGIVYYDNWYYLTMPRMKAGVPATLGRITALSGGSTAPLIEPYPSWDFNKEGECETLQNVQNIEIDTSGKMWILDGGHTRSLSQNPVKNCSPKLIIHDIKTNQTKTTYVFPETVASKLDSFLYDLVVDDANFAYISDNSARDPGIIVYSRLQNRSWKIRHSKTMRADSTAQSFRLNGVPINSAINIAGIALGPKIKTQNGSGIIINEDREVFYCPISSVHLYSISTSVLQDEASSNNGQDYTGNVRDVGVKGSQTDGMLMTSKGILYYGLLSENAIAYWDTQKPLATGQKVISKDVVYIQWTNSFTIDNEANLIVLTDTLQKFIHGPLDLKKYNFWLLSANINDTSYLYEDPTYEYIPVIEGGVSVNPNITKGDVSPGKGSKGMIELGTILVVAVVFILVY